MWTIRSRRNEPDREVLHRLPRRARRDGGYQLRVYGALLARWNLGPLGVWLQRHPWYFRDVNVRPGPAPGYSAHYRSRQKLVTPGPASIPANRALPPSFIAQMIHHSRIDFLVYTAEQEPQNYVEQGGVISPMMFGLFARHQARNQLRRIFETEKAERWASSSPRSS